MKTVRLSPSDISWSWDRCKRCFFRKLHGFQSYGERMPALYRLADTGMKRVLTAEHLKRLGIPAASMREGSMRLLSEPLEFADLDLAITIGGEMDACAVMEDGSLAVVEYKSGKPDQGDQYGYWRQVSAYAWALRHPHPSANAEPERVSSGHIVYSWMVPERAYRISVRENEMLTSIVGYLRAMPVSIEEAPFALLLRNVAEVFAGPLPPSDTACNFCATLQSAAAYDRDMEARR